MSAQRAEQARKLGQSLWYDNISRSLLNSGELARLIQGGIITGITTNPSIFQKAVEGSTAYDAAIKKLVAQGKTAEEVYHQLTLDDVREAADLLRPVHDRSHGIDGYVSLEVLPSLASDEDSTVKEALRLFHALDRPNVMIKVPGTRAGAEAFRRLTEAGVNVNVTLLFSLDQYVAIARAYIAGLRARARAGQPVSGIASVASFFVSRVDSSVDQLLEAAAAKNAASAAAMRAQIGTTGIANCKVVYQKFRELFGADFADLRKAGAQVQRVLWASTSTKNPDFPDVLYVDTLLGADTVNTLPPATLDAFMDHGDASRATIEVGLDEARAQLARLDSWGIDLGAACAKLQVDGVAAFSKAFDGLLGSLEKKIPVSG